jgi:PAS domain S-box-containing protein
VSAAQAADRVFSAESAVETRLGTAGGAERFEVAAEAGCIGVFELDLEARRLSGSPRYWQNLGHTAGAPVSWDDVSRNIHPDDRARRDAAFDAAVASGSGYDIEYRVVLSDGSLRWLQVRAQVVRSEGGNACLAGITLDITTRRLAEQQLELSEESLRLAADSAEIGTWDLDLTTEVLTWSDRTKAMFGISADVVCSMADFYAGLHPDDYAATVAAFASALDPRLRATYDVEYRTIGREDQVVRWVAAKGRGLFHDGVCRRAIGTAIDITARKRAAIREGFLLQLMDRLRHLHAPEEITQVAVEALGRHLGAARVGYSHVQPDDATTVIETCFADGVAALAGSVRLDSFGPASIAWQRRGETIVVGDVNDDGRNDPAAWAEIETRAYVSVPLIRDGKLRATLFVNHRAPHCWDPGDVALIEDVAARTWDAVELARAEAALRALNAGLATQVDARRRELDRVWRLSPVLMVMAGLDGVLVSINPAWTRVLGWSAEETVGRDVMEFVAPEDYQASAAGMAMLFEGRPVMEYHTVFLTRQGGRRRIAWTTVPEDGMLYGFGRDVTEQILAEERLRQAQKMEAVGQLTGGIAHDFNNLLTGLSGSLELLDMRMRQGQFGEMGRYIEAAQAAGRRAASLTQRLLAFSRQQTLDAQPTDGNALVRGMEELIRRSVGPELEIVIEAAADLWPTLVDPHQLENALLNLCINARDAMPGGGCLRIATENRWLDAAAAAARDLPAGAYVCLSVADTGMGMTAEVKARAFDPFFTTKPPGSGTGLGLSMIYGFARQSGGQVQIDSEPGQGTVVSLLLPRCAEAAAGPQDEAPRGRAWMATRRGTVLLVDDEIVVRHLAAEVLGERGMIVLQAADGASGLQMLRAHCEIDVLVTDVGLPGGMNGRQFAEMARDVRPGLPILFITGYAEEAGLRVGSFGAASRLLCKPFPLEALAACVGEMLDQAVVLS